MIDSYLFLTPILVLGIIALLGFVGCDVVFGLDRPPIPPPTNLIAVPGDGRVDLSWDAYDNATEYHLGRGTASGVYSDTHTILAPATTYADNDVTNGTGYFYGVTAIVSGGESPTSNEAEATPTAAQLQAFVTSTVLGSLRNQLTAWAGMTIQIGPNAITVQTLGRIFAAGNIVSHRVKIVDSLTSLDLTVVSVDVATGIVGDFVYTSLVAPLTLRAGAIYHIVSEEVAGGDHLYLEDTIVQTTAVATVISAVTGTTQGVYTQTDAAGHTFGPLDFKY